MQLTPPAPRKGDTYRTPCGRGRSTYDPDWSPSRPWSCVWLGEVRNYFATLGQAQARLAELAEERRQRDRAIMELR